MYDHSIELLIIYSCCGKKIFFYEYTNVIFGFQFTQFFLKLCKTPKTSCKENSILVVSVKQIKKKIPIGSDVKLCSAVVLGFPIHIIFCNGASNDQSCIFWVQSNMQFIRKIFLYIFPLAYSVGCHKITY